jgi:pimeloyl-ACP methyl ester carboxylesterase
MEPLSHRRAALGSVTLHYVEAGHGSPVIFLHGFPEFWYSWQHQITAVAAAGFRAIAPDLRGYNESDKPPRVADYRLELLVDDVARLISLVGGAPAIVVGHDWGGVIAWELAMRRPELVARLVILNAPHPAAFMRELHTPRQLLRSWYMFFFQLPWLPEWRIAAGDYALLRRTFPPCFTTADIDRYKQALMQPGALTAMVNYYRAAMRYPSSTARHGRIIQAPTLLIWGERDPFLGVRLTEGLTKWAPGLRVERWRDVGHWVQNEAPERVNALLVEFLQNR